MSLTTPFSVQKLQAASHAEVCFGARLFREPDAGNLPVRFDEREQETEPSQTGLRWRRESFVSSHRETKATAPVLDSTRHYTNYGVPRSRWRVWRFPVSAIADNNK
jgi:hypothetical protein